MLGFTRKSWDLPKSDGKCANSCGIGSDFGLLSIGFGKSYDLLTTVGKSVICIYLCGVKCKMDLIDI